MRGVGEEEGIGERGDRGKKKERTGGKKIENANVLVYGQNPVGGGRGEEGRCLFYYPENSEQNKNSFQTFSEKSSVAFAGLYCR